MKVFKKNQLVIWVIALMLIAAGYLNYSSKFMQQDIPVSSSENKIQNDNNQNNKAVSTIEDKNLASIGDATLVNGELVSNDNLEESTQANASPNKENIDNNENKETTTSNIQTNIDENNKEPNNNVDSSDYFVTSKLERETMYSQMLASYQKIIDSTTISAEQKGIAQQEINKINETKNAIMITENLMKTKGFNDAVVFVNGNSVNTVIKAEQLTTQQVAQIQNIISRELKAEIEDIHITSK